jgi:hypothetical protein
MLSCSIRHANITPCLLRNERELMRSFRPIPCGLATPSAILKSMDRAIQHQQQKKKSQTDVMFNSENMI